MTVQYQGVWSLQSAAQLQSTQRWVTDPLYKNTTLLLQADDAANGSQNNTFLDSSSNNFAITRNGNTTQGSFTPFSSQPGAWSNSFNGSNTLIKTPDTSITGLDLTGDFTIECWFYATGNTGHLINRGGGTGIAWASYEVWTGNTNNVYFAASSANSGYDIGGENSTGLIGSYALNTWNHVAVTRSGNVYRGFLNGVQGYTQTLSLTPYTATGRGITIGGAYQNSWGVVGNIFSVFAGNISNVRIVKGTALYTSNFTPSPNPLTAVTNTSLLTCQSNQFIDNSTNNYTITTGNAPSVQAFSPFAPQFQWTPSVIGGSGYFDGTGDYLSSATSTDLQLGSSDFSLEWWEYRTAANNVDTAIVCGDGTFSALLGYYNSGAVRFYLSTTGSSWNVFSDTSAGTTASNSWNHFVLTRSGTAFRVFLNGVLGAYATGSGSVTQTTNQIFISGGINGSSVPIEGYMSGVRFVKGSIPTSYQTSSTTTNTPIFTPPTAPVTTTSQGATSGDVKYLVNFTNAGIYDGTMKNNLETVGNAQVSTAVVKYGSGSMFFDGTGDWLLASDVSMGNFGSSDFTVEFWAYDLARSSSGTVWISKWGTAASLGRSWIFGYVNSSGNLVFNISTNGSTETAAVSVSFTPTLRVWNHYAITRLGSTYRVFVNGTLVGTGTNSGTLYSADKPLCVGANYEDVQNSSNVFAVNGYLDDLRITRGIARYTQNFIPPSVALPRQ